MVSLLHLRNTETRKISEQDAIATEAAQETTKRGFTFLWRDIHNEPDDSTNPIRDAKASAEKIGTVQDCKERIG